MNDEIGDYGRGWAFCKGGGVRNGGSLPALGGDLREWVYGYAAALADVDPMGDEHASIESALRADGIEGDLLERVLQEAEAIEQKEGEEWFRWPGVPVRHSAQALADRDKRLASFAGLLDGDTGTGATKAAIEQIQADLPRIFGGAVNDEMG
jgi:hypothetical protein